MNEPPLPGMPEPPPVKARASSRGVRATRVQPRRLCVECCRLIHAMGQATAPYPRSGRWRVHLADLTTADLCDAHKDEALE